MKTNVALLLFVASTVLAQEAPSPYAGQEGREIKSLSAEDVDSYLAGKGMGLAKAAELNGYAGPKHVLELAPQLDLTPGQLARTEALLASMSAEAASLGQLLVAEERKLDRLFAAREITPELLSRSVAEIGALQAKVRAVHLQAHLAQVDILAPEQNKRYNELRGYAGSAGTSAAGSRHEHQHQHQD